MGPWLTVARIAMGVNIIFLVGVSYVWGRNYRRIHSKYVLALFLFAALLIAENTVALYFFSLNPLTSRWLETAPATAQIAMLLLRLLETSALVLLTWAMWQ
jgi:hypothetical protein